MSHPSGNLFIVGLSWRTAHVATREQLAFREEETGDALREILSSPSIGEVVILSTCNRVEIYGATRAGQHSGADPLGAGQAVSEIRNFFARSRRVSTDLLAEQLYEQVDEEAVRHLFRVASALDSMVVGEPQILGQLKAAYGAAMRAKATGPVLSRSMERAFAVAKRVRTETGISRGAASVSSVAVELASQVFGELVGHKVLVVGAGKMSALAARHLRAAGAQSITVTNRSPAKAAELAARVDGTARPWAELPGCLADADVVISSTGAKEPVLTRALVKGAMKARKWRPQVVVDIAVPRDADPAIGKIDGVYLFDIDDLERVVARNLGERHKEASAAMSIIEQEVTGHRQWLRAQRVVPTIRSLREHFHQVAAEEADRCIAALARASGPEEVERAVRRMSELLANKLLHGPTSRLKESNSTDLEAFVAVTERLFDLSRDQELERQASGTSASTEGGAPSNAAAASVPEDPSHARSSDPDAQTPAALAGRAALEIKKPA